jgi:hypothetical protein
MKNMIFVFMITITFLLGCNKENESTPTMKASIDGKAWNADIRATVLSNNKFAITGTNNATGKSISITVLGITEGTYNLDINSFQCEAVYKQSYTTTTDDTYFAYTGTLVLTKVDLSHKRISGTFSFKLKKNLSNTTVIIDNGTFEDLRYTDGTVQ